MQKGRDVSYAAAVDRILSGPGWRWKALLIVLAISLFRAFPSYDALATPFVETTWRNALLKVDHPMADMARLFPPESHESKLTLRLAVPLFAHILHLDETGLLIFSFIAGALLLYVVIALAAKLGAGRKAALFTSLSVACAWAGEAGFHELRGGFYDGPALCLLLLAMWSDLAPVAGLCVFLAAWTDERALIASPFVILLSIASSKRGFVPALLTAKPIAVVVAWLAYLAVRIILINAYSLSIATGGVGLAVLAEQTNMIPLGIWTGLSGAWIFVTTGIAAAFEQKRRGLAAAFAAELALTIAAALLVIDITRSMAYCLPAVPVALSILMRNASLERVERLAKTSAIVSLIAPTYYAQGGTGLWWLYPLPIQIVRWIYQSL